MIFPLPVADAAFVARWQRKVARAMSIFERTRDVQSRTHTVAYRLLYALMRQRDAIVDAQVDAQRTR